ncbi:MAG: DUF3078 domain-containing protein [Prevotellaceae bacterium]|jgi:hypothetical protein|nr:DUF3078 domain-containing protein [Prevotellaceae bacterium]
MKSAQKNNKSHKNGTIIVNYFPALNIIVETLSAMKFAETEKKKKIVNNYFFNRSNIFRLRSVFVLSVLLCLLNSSVMQAQTAEKKPEPKKPSLWKYNGSTNLNFVQSSYSNWSSGGENAIAGSTGGNIKLNYAKAKLSWENGLTLGYGLTYQGSKRSKNNDRIDFYSKFGYKAFGKVDYTAQVTFNTQFDKGYARYPIAKDALYNSKFMSPATLVLAVGFDYKPSGDFSLVLSPISGKFTFVLDDSLSKIGVYGVTRDKHVYYELGAYVRANYNKKIKNNITISSYMDIFSNLLRDPEKADINWDFTLTVNVTKYISSNLNFQLKYDDDTKHITAGKGPAVQFKQTLGIGFGYNF